MENAVDFARDRVEVAARVDDEDVVAVTISDDGPGFAPEIMARIGEPYVTSRRHRLNDAGDEPPGWASASSSPRRCWSARAPRYL